MLVGWDEWIGVGFQVERWTAGLGGACLCYAKDPAKGVGGGMEQ